MDLLLYRPSFFPVIFFTLPSECTLVRLFLFVFLSPLPAGSRFSVSRLAGHRYTLNHPEDRTAVIPRENELVEGLKRGENKAFRTLFDTCYYPLFCVASQYVHDEFTADTIVGDLFFRIWEQRETLQIETSLQAYLVQAVRNCCLNYLRQTFLEKEISLDKYRESPEAVLQGLFLSDDYPLGRLIEKEFDGRLREAVSLLPPETQKVFRLSRDSGLTYPEIARRTGISVNTVKYHIKQALALLRERLKDCFVLLLASFPPFI